VAPEAPVSQTPVVSAWLSLVGSSICRSRRLVQYQLSLAAPVSVAPVDPVAVLWLLYCSVVPVCTVVAVAVSVVPVSMAGVAIDPVAPVLRFHASVDIDDYQKRSPVENVLESTGDLHVVVSNQVLGKHSIQSKSVVAVG